MSAPIKSSAEVYTDVSKASNRFCTNLLKFPVAALYDIHIIN